MNITIPPGATFGYMTRPLFDWLEANGVDPSGIDGSQPLSITEVVTAATVFGTTVQRPVLTEMPQDLAQFLDDNFGGPAAVALDDMSQLIDRLAQARAEEKAAKERADEARAQILARLELSGASLGTVGGRPAVEWRRVEKKQFQTAKFRADHPDMADQYTSTRTENRLELL